MNEETTEQMTFDLTCFDGTVFTLPSNHPKINIGGIGGISYNTILEDPSKMPAEFEQFRTFTPPPPEPYVEPERPEPMTKRQLIERLEALAVPDDTPVYADTTYNSSSADFPAAFAFISKDETEANGFCRELTICIADYDD